MIGLTTVRRRRTLCWAIAGFATSCLVAPANGMIGTDGWLDDGVPAHEREVTYGSGPVSAGGDRDVIIIHRSEPWAFFGMYRASQMTDPGWDLYERSIDWANGFGEHATTTIWLATYNGTLDPDFSAERDGIAVYNRLINNMGFDPGNIHVAHQSTIETADFTGYDIVLYAWSFPRNAQNVIDQDKPFVTVAASQTDELGIGTGVVTMHEFRDSAYVVNTNYYPTEGYDYGEFFLDEGMFMDATTVAGDGILLVTADDRGDDGACCFGDECAVTHWQECTACTRDPEWVCDLDVDGDGQVNPVDAGLVQAAFGSGDSQDICNYDVDCDGQINPVDAGLVQAAFGTCDAPRAPCGGRFLGIGSTCDDDPCGP